MTPESKGSQKLNQSTNSELDHDMSACHENQPEDVSFIVDPEPNPGIKLKDDGELGLVEIPDWMDHETAIHAQKQSIGETQRCLAKAMPKHIKRLVDVNKQLHGNLFTELGKRSRNLTLLAKDYYHSVQESSGYILINKYGFYICRAIHSEYTPEGVSLLKGSDFEDPRLLSGETITIDFKFFNIHDGIQEDFIHLHMIDLSEANEIINGLINKQLEEQKNERALFEKAAENSKREVETILEDELEIPEIPNNKTAQTNTVQRRVSNFFSNIFSKKKKN